VLQQASMPETYLTQIAGTDNGRNDLRTIMMSVQRLS
jgi:hypothetical protein